MAKKKNSRMRKVAGIRIPKPLAKALRRFLDTPFGREVAAAALTAAAQTLVTRYPMAATASAGSGVAGAAKTVAGHAVESVAHVLHGASDRLRSAASHHREEEDDDDRARAFRAGTRDDDGGGKPRRSGKAKASRLEDSLFADLSPKQLRKLAKAAQRH